MPSPGIPEDKRAEVIRLLPAFKDTEIAEQVGVHRMTVAKVRCAERARLEATPIGVQPTPERVQVAPHCQPGAPCACAAPEPAPLPVAPTVAPPPFDGPMTVVLFGDVHVPYHDKVAWQVFLNATHALEPDALVCIGDFPDCYTLSKYRKNPARLYDWQGEQCAIDDELDRVDAIGVDDRRMAGGNHDERWPIYLKERAPELYRDDAVPDMFKLRERGWHWTPYMQRGTIGNLRYTHHYKRGGIYATRYALQDMGHSVVVGHDHRLNVWHEGTDEEPTRTAGSVGWLGSPEMATYKHRTAAECDWQHGFIVAHLDPERPPMLIPVPIVDGGCTLPDGRRIRA